MNRLPDELITDVLDYLDPHDVISTQRTSHRLLKLARDPALWRYKCFEKAPSAAHALANRPNALSALAGALGGLSLGADTNQPVKTQLQRPAEPTRASRRAKAVVEWDCSDASEKINWYSEYVARHAPLSVEWAERSAGLPEVRGMALYGNGEKVVGPTDDGSLYIWNIARSINGRPNIIASSKSRPGLLFEDLSSTSQASRTKKRSLGYAVDNISIDHRRKRAYVASETQLNEVDLERMELVAQLDFAWPITALSQDQSWNDYRLTVGTSWSLHIHDPRLPLRMLFSKPDDGAQVDNKETSKIAFLPNYTKLKSLRGSSEKLESPRSQADYFDSIPRGGLKAYARVEPGPQSIIHRREHEIIIAGRMPSILFYDRRFFPRLKSFVHSGARLSSMTMVPFKPSNVTASSSSGQSDTLIACGEYNGRGSLELYELPGRGEPTMGAEGIDLQAAQQSSYKPWSHKNRQEASSSKLLSVAVQGTRIVFSDAEGQLKWVERNGRGLARRWNINSYTLTAQGASISGEQVVRKMIPLCDGECETLDTTGSKWPSKSSSPFGSSHTLSVPSSSSSSFITRQYQPREDSEGDDKNDDNDHPRGTHQIPRPDSDLLVWTGEKIGLVTTKPHVLEDTRHDNLVAAFERQMDLNLDAEEELRHKEKEDEYARRMRMALEGQANERIWMSRFGRRRWR